MRISDWSSDVCSSDLRSVRQRWTWLLENLDQPLAQSLDTLNGLGRERQAAALAERLARQPAASIFDLVQDPTLRVSWQTEVRSLMERYLAGADCAAVLAEIPSIHDRVLTCRVFSAVH